MIFFKDLKDLATERLKKLTMDELERLSGVDNVILDGENYYEVVNVATLDFCKAEVVRKCLKYPQIKFFTLSVAENDERTKFITTISFLDAERNLFCADGTTCEYVFYAGRIGESLASFLGGSAAVTAKINITRGVD